MFKSKNYMQLRSDCRLQPLDETWAFDIFLRWGGLESWKVGAWSSSFYHWCPNGNMPLRCDYIKRINDYYPDGSGKPAKASLHHKYDKPFCHHCGAVMPTKYARLFQAFFLGERLRVIRNKTKDYAELFSGTKTGRS